MVSFFCLKRFSVDGQGVPTIIGKSLPRTDFWPHNDPIWSCILDSTLWQVLDSRILCQRNLDYGFLELNSGFTKPWIPDLQSSGFRIPLAEISRILDSSSNVSWIPESGLPYMGRDSSCMQAVAIALIVRTVPCRIRGDSI